MFVIDTNVVSEPMKPKPDERVLTWLDRQDPPKLFFTAISYAEVVVGLAWMPDGRRKRNLEVLFARLVERHFGDRILPFDLDAAIAATHVINRARASGYNFTREDGQIAAIAAARGFAVATRDVEPFEAAGIAVVNPWNADV